MYGVIYELNLVMPNGIARTTQYGCLCMLGLDKVQLQTHLIVIRKRGERLIEPHALKLLVVGINAEDLKLSGGNANKRLEILFECSQCDPLVNMDK